VLILDNLKAHKAEKQK